MCRTKYFSKSAKAGSPLQNNIKALRVLVGTAALKRSNREVVS